MPTISVLKRDLYRLIGLESTYPLARLNDDLILVKGELGSRTRDGRPLRSSDGEWIDPGEDAYLRVELADTNRPDLWCVEGIARQLRDHRAGTGRRYDFYTHLPAQLSILVDAGLESIRPYIGGFLAEGGVVDEDGLLAFIEGQEALDRNFGRRRKAVSIGLYAGSGLHFPLHYRAVGLDDIRFEPLAPSGTLRDGDSWPAGGELTPREILQRHPTGREYAGILDGSHLVPLLMDDGGGVLSLIPIINSAGLGRVKMGMSSLLVEATGVDLNQVLLTLNILAANLHDRGWAIRPVTSEYPYDTSLGRAVPAPYDLAITQQVPLGLFNRVLGEEITLPDIIARLQAYGVSAEPSEDGICAAAPSYRQDYLHPVDVTEDFAISRGYSAFIPLLPADFTVGKLHPLTRFEDRVRDLMIGFGFEEAVCNILTSTDLIRLRMDVSDQAGSGMPPFHGGKAVSIQNVMNLNYAVLRDWILPSLLEIESHSEGALYPHRVFEAGEVAVFDLAENLGSRTEMRLAGLIADELASFDSVQSVVYALLTALKIPFQVLARDHPSMIPGRSALIVARDPNLSGGNSTALDDAASSDWFGFLGECSPRVLTHWGARVPISAFELSIEALYRFWAGA